jgi:hypothetical protein
MADSAKPIAALLASFADGQPAGSITPQTMRNLVLSTALLQINTQTANYTLGLTDRVCAVDMNSATAVTVTVPQNSSVPFDVGTVLEVCQYGAGQVTIVPAAGVTLRTPSATLTTRAQYSSVSLRQRAVDEWIVSGDLT